MLANEQNPINIPKYFQNVLWLTQFTFICFDGIGIFDRGEKFRIILFVTQGILPTSKK